MTDEQREAARRILGRLQDTFACLAAIIEANRVRRLGEGGGEGGA